jgi:hypothetical protein
LLTPYAVFGASRRDCFRRSDRFIAINAGAQVLRRISHTKAD